MNKVSVVIPSYNHRVYIGKAIDSVLTQSHEDLELIVIDDGSSDDSLEYLREIKDPRYTLVEQANAGAHNAINRGLDLATGNYLAILNSDDIFHPDRLKRCLEAMRANDSELVTSWIEVINQQGQPLGVKQGWQNMLPWPIADLKNSFAGTNSFELNLFVSNFVSTTSNMLFTRNLYKTIGGMRNLRFAHDWDFMFRAAQQFRCSLIESPLMQYRIHGSNTISSNRAWMLFEICWVLASGMRRLESSLFYTGTDHQQWMRDAERIYNSVNLQGNDKIYWMIRQFVDVQEKQGNTNAELLLLDDAELRQAFIRHIVTGADGAPTSSAQTAGTENLISRLKRRLRQSLKS